MERTQRVAKLEALLARVQSRSNRGETHGNAAVAMPQPAAAAPVARVAPAPVAQAAQPAAQPVQAPPKVAATPKPSPVAASTPPVAQAAPLAAHETQEEAATVVRDVPAEALAAIAAATAAATAQGQSNLAPQAAANPPPEAAAPAPAFRGTAFGGLSKKMTLIGTAPPANWPPRGAETSVPPPDPTAAATVAAAAPAAAEEAPQDTHEAAPEIQASESEGDLDALLGNEASQPVAPPAVDEKPAAAPMAAPVVAAASTAIAEPKKADLPIVSAEAPLAKKKSRSSLTVFIMIVLWLIALGVIWFMFRSQL